MDIKYLPEDRMRDEINAFNGQGEAGIPDIFGFTFDETKKKEFFPALFACKTEGTRLWLTLYLPEEYKEVTGEMKDALLAQFIEDQRGERNK